MRICFLDPPVLIGKRPPERVFGCTYGLYPIPNIFLLQVAAVLKKEGHIVEYKNFPLDKVIEAGFIEYLKETFFDVYCIYSVNLAREIDLKAFKIIKGVKNNCKVIFFGPAPTYSPKDYLIDEDIVVVSGEPELTFSELICQLENNKHLSKINGIAYKENGEVQVNPPRQINPSLDTLPFPARELIDSKKYYNPKFSSEKFTAVSTSRGCPYRCKFCVPNSLSFAREVDYKKTHSQKPPYTTRSAKNVIDEFKMLQNQGYSAISILDDEFIIDKKRVIEICKGIKGLGIKWGCLSRADTLNEELLREMSFAGCKYIDIGVESFDQEILNDINKNLDIKTIENTIRLAKKYGVFVKINILFGSSPLESRETIRKSLKAIKELKPDAVMFSICNPFPGTEYYQIAKKSGWFVKGDYYPIDVQKESTITLPKISKKELELSIRKANISFFMNPKIAYRHLRKIKSLKELTEKTSVLLKKIF